MKELFDKEFVHFLWDDGLDGKECFVASEIDDLIRAVNENSKGHKYKVHKSNDPSWPFQAESDCEPSCFAYYDPLYEYKIAWANGKSIEVIANGCKYLYINGINDEPDWQYTISRQYNIAPDVYFVHKDKLSGELYYDDCSVGAIYQGTEENCIKYKNTYDPHFEEWFNNYKNNPEVACGIKVSLLASEDVVSMLKDAYLEGRIMTLNVATGSTD